MSAAASWAAEDDILLKNAVEAGASLESLAKGAVCFSRKFTLQELQDRWCSLLYDSETSGQASALIVKYETELSTSNPTKAHKLFYVRRKHLSLRKRKIESVKNQYYAMRKRICYDPCLAADFGYVITPCSCPVGSDCVCDELFNLLEGHHLVHNVNQAADVVNGCGHIGESYADGQDVHAKDNGHYISHQRHDKASGRVATDGNTNCESANGCSDVGKLYGYNYMPKNIQSSERNIASPKDLSDVQDCVQLQQPLPFEESANGMTGLKALLNTDQDCIKQSQFSGNSNGRSQEPGSLKAISEHWCSQAPSALTRKKFQGVNSPDMLTDVHHKEQEILAFSDDKKKETTNIDTLSFKVNGENGMSGSGLDNVTEGEVMHSCLMDSSQSEDFELLNSDNILDSSLDPNLEGLGDRHVNVILKDISKEHLLDIPHVSSACGNNTDPIHEKHDVADISGADMLCTSEVPFPGAGIVCILNTEDPEIPCNDDIFIPGPVASTSTCDQNSQHNMHLVSTKPIPPLNAAELNHTDLVSDVQPLLPTMKLEPYTLEQKETLVALNESCTVRSKSSVMHVDVDASNANACTSTFHYAAEFVKHSTPGLVQHEGVDNLGSVALDECIGVLDEMNSKFPDEPGISCDATTQNSISSHALPHVEFLNPITTTSSPEGGGSDSEDGIPNYFDIEALILDQDLIPWDQESDFIQPEVSRFQSLESRKDLVRLEQGTRSYTNRSIMSHGAFAVLYGQHLKYYIKDPEVTLGRETSEEHVDIDLGKEGKANTISRQQAIIKMDKGGSFHIKNIGKAPVFVNSKEVPCNECTNLISDALLQIRHMKFIFHINQDAVRQHIIRSRRGTSQGKYAVFEWDEKP
uniref:FHA domain-containing protein n=1 Tax=Oryza punctata TaxID=4537 RepID=A0A0E0LI24_ORYPU